MKNYNKLWNAVGFVLYTLYVCVHERRMGVSRCWFNGKRTARLEKFDLALFLSLSLSLFLCVCTCSIFIVKTSLYIILSIHPFFVLRSTDTTTKYVYKYTHMNIVMAVKVTLNRHNKREELFIIINFMCLDFNFKAKKKFFSDLFLYIETEWKAHFPRNNETCHNECFCSIAFPHSMEHLS